MVEDGWEPMKPPRTRLPSLLVLFALGMVAIPGLAFLFTYLMMSR